MFKALRRWWRYLGTKLGMQLDEVADPKVQLEQAISEARAQHRLLTDQAANVIAGQVQLQGRLDRAIEDYGRVTASARQALLLADQARQAGDERKTTAMEQAAEGFAARLIVLEREIDSLKRSLLDATAASDRAKQAVATSSAVLQKRLAEREALLGKLEQAQMQEQMNAAMRQLSAGVGSDVPTLDEVREKIDRRYAAAQAMTEISGVGVDVRMLEVEQAQRAAETEARLGVLRSQLGISVTRVERPALAATTSTSQALRGADMPGEVAPPQAGPSDGEEPAA